MPNDEICYQGLPPAPRCNAITYPMGWESLPVGKSSVVKRKKSNFENKQPSSCSLSELGSRHEMEKLFPMLSTKSEVSAANLQLISSEFWKASKACNASVMSSTTSQRHKNLEFAANLLPPSLRTIAMPTTKLWNIAISCTRASSSFCRICGKLQINRPKNLSRNFWEKHLQVLRK